MNKIENILKSSLRIWNQLNDNEKNDLINNAIIINYKKNDLIHKGDFTCLGLIVVNTGIIRAFMASPNGKQITLYKLYNNDICLFSASCIMKNINFEIYLECEEDCEILLIPTEKYKNILNRSFVLSNYINNILSSRFSDIMWIFEQFVFSSLDKRLAEYLLNQKSDSNNIIIITHEKIANELGTAREVISRMLKYFENEKIITLQRNKIIILNENKLFQISEKK
ncbi:MAG: Crp/Fnr family transcriptional regulator [Bacilli bacterium]|nr:Crp/Fnr family transcriptional regulator [Bacilli bacterium]